MDKAKWLYERVFDALDARLASETDTTIWTIGNGPQPLQPKDRDVRYGNWYAEAVLDVAGDYAGVSVALTPGEARIGLILPATLVDSEDGAREQRIGMALTGEKPTRSRPLHGGRWIFDYDFKDGVFAPEFFLSAMKDPDAADALGLRVGHLVMTLWKGATQIMVETRDIETYHTYSIVSGKPISVHDLSRLGGIPFRLTRADQMPDGSYIMFVETQAELDTMRSIVGKIGGAEVDLLDEIEPVVVGEEASDLF
jgi:hypothetical protein